MFLDSGEKKQRGGISLLFNLPACFPCFKTHIRTTAARISTLPGLKHFQPAQTIRRIFKPFMSLQKQQAQRRGGCSRVERSGVRQWVSLGFVESPCSAASLLPLPEQSLPSCEPDPVTWLAAWGHGHATLSFGTLQPQPRAHASAATCPRSKVTFVRAKQEPQSALVWIRAASFRW